MKLPLAAVLKPHRMLLYKYCSLLATFTTGLDNQVASYIYIYTLASVTLKCVCSSAKTIMILILSNSDSYIAFISTMVLQTEVTIGNHNCIFRNNNQR